MTNRGQHTDEFLRYIDLLRSKLPSSVRIENEVMYEWLLKIKERYEDSYYYFSLCFELWCRAPGLCALYLFEKEGHEPIFIQYGLNVPAGKVKCRFKFFGLHPADYIKAYRSKVFASFRKNTQRNRADVYKRT